MLTHADIARYVMQEGVRTIIIALVWVGVMIALKRAKETESCIFIKNRLHNTWVSSTDYNLVSEGEDIWIVVSRGGTPLGKIYSKTAHPTVEAGLLYEEK